MDSNSQKPINSNKTRLNVTVHDIIISEGMFFNIDRKPIFRKVLYLARNVFKSYIPLNTNLVPKELLDVIHEQNMKSNLTMLKK